VSRKAAYFTVSAVVFASLFCACPRPVPKTMTLIKGGTFTMGSPVTDPDFIDWEGPQHEVTLNPFYLGKYTVTQEEYLEITGSNPGYPAEEGFPVNTVNWFEAVEFCNAMSRRDRLKPAYTVNDTEVVWNEGNNGYRLPTEAEWEYACRAGTTTRYSTGDQITGEQARFRSDSQAPSGSFPPNPWGLYDMHGNLYEWCWDWYGLYSAEPQQNPRGPESGTQRIIRGGSAASMERHLRSAVRSRVEPNIRNVNLGFRIARNIK